MDPTSLPSIETQLRIGIGSACSGVRCTPVYPHEVGQTRPSTCLTRESKPSNQNIIWNSTFLVVRETSNPYFMLKNDSKQYFISILVIINSPVETMDPNVSFQPALFANLLRQSAASAGDTFSRGSKISVPNPTQTICENPRNQREKSFSRGSRIYSLPNPTGSFCANLRNLRETQFLVVRES